MKYTAIIIALILASTPFASAQSWPISSNYYVSDPPSAPLNNVDCTQVSNVTIAARIANSSEPYQQNVRVFAAGQTVTIEGEVGQISNICNGYAYTCEAFRVYGCKHEKKTFSESYTYRECPSTLPDRIYAEGETSETCWGCILTIVAYFGSGIAMALGVPPEIALTVANYIAQVAPMVDNPSCVDTAKVEEIARKLNSSNDSQRNAIPLPSFPAFNCDLMGNNDVKCWSVCAKSFKTKPSARPSCLDAQVKNYAEAKYSCNPRLCGGYADKEVEITISQHGMTIMSDVTRTDSNGKFLYTFTSPDIDDIVDVIVTTQI